MRMAQTSRSFNGGFWPISLPRFQGLKPAALLSDDGVVGVVGIESAPVLIPVHPTWVGD